MGSAIYVTEPDVIDLDVVRNVLGKDVKIVPGTTSFSYSEDQECDALLIRSATTITKDIKAHFPSLKAVIRVGVGLDNVDLDYCKEEGITVYNAPGANADAVSEYVVAVILYALRKLHKLSDQRVKDWDRFAFRGGSVREQTIGIVGFGHIGKLLYEKLNSFSHPEFLVYDPYVTADKVPFDNVRLTSLEELLRDSTVVSLHLPLIPETNHIINADKLALMHEDALLINASRGGIVDEDAVVDCLEAGKSFTYIADAVEGEPKVNERLLGNENIIVTPHIASLTTFSEKEMIRQSLDNYLQSVSAKIFG